MSKDSSFLQEFVIKKGNSNKIAMAMVLNFLRMKWKIPKKAVSVSNNCSKCVFDL